MYLRERKASTDPRLRSLVQKAVRRGYGEIVEKTARRLNETGDKTWLRSRSVVITFEECWPLAEQIALDREIDSKICMLVRVTHAVKHKDAAGLGAMAYAYHEGDKSMIAQFVDARPLQVIAEALNRPADFFKLTESQCITDRQRAIVGSAQKYLAAATWGWDKACILAGAFLASAQEVPEITVGKKSFGEFPYWVALDKHTPQGKEALRAVAARLRLPYRRLIWSGFYLESAATNELAKSPWWEAEMTWRLKKAGLTIDSAVALWEKVKPLLREQLESEEVKLRALVESDIVGQKEMFGTL